MVENFSYFFCNEGNRPRKKVHEVGKKIGMWTLSELLDIECIVLNCEMFTSNFMTAPLLL